MAQLLPSIYLSVHDYVNYLSIVSYTVVRVLPPAVHSTAQKMLHKMTNNNLMLSYLQLQMDCSYLVSQRSPDLTGLDDDG